MYVLQSKASKNYELDETLDKIDKFPSFVGLNDSRLVTVYYAIGGPDFYFARAFHDFYMCIYMINGSYGTSSRRLSFFELRCVLSIILELAWP